MKAKLTAFKPKYKNNSHEVFESQHGTLYKFILTFEGVGDVEGNAKTTSPKWDLNTEYTFDVREHEKYGKSISNLKKVDDNRGSYTPAQFNKDEALNIAYQVALDCAIDYFANSLKEVNETDFKKVVKYIYTFLAQRCTDRKNSIMSQAAMKRAVKVMTAGGIKFTFPEGTSTINKLEHLIHVYNIFFEMIETNGGN